VPVTPVESGQRLQLLQFELIKRRVVRFNTKAYELDQQIASKMIEAEEASRCNLN
jgi:hypothetical protein